MKGGRRFLTNTTPNIDFCVLPGGRVEMGEDTISTVNRELMEELGVEVDVLGLKAMTENFFNFDGFDFHEIQYTYIAKLKDKTIEKYTTSFMGVENKGVYNWHSIDELKDINYKPACLKKAIEEVGNGNCNFVHIINK